MTNRSTEKSPFQIVYTKLPNHIVDLTIIPKFKRKTALDMINNFNDLLHDVKAHLSDSALQYKKAADVHKRYKVFEEGELVMIHLRKERFPVGTYNKLKPRKLGPFQILKRINDNAYMVALPPELNISPIFNIADIYTYHPPDGIQPELETTSFDKGEGNGAASNTI